MNILPILIITVRRNVNIKDLPYFSLAKIALAGKQAKR